MAVQQRKRSREEPAKPTKNPEEDFQVEGLLDAGSDSEDDADLEAELGDEETDAEYEEDSDGEDEEEQEEEVDPRRLGRVTEDEDEEEEPSLADDASSSDGEYELGANGEPRKIYPEFDVGYDTDSSTGSVQNTIGNIPLDKYADFPHIGYDINGHRIMRPLTKSALDALLDTMDHKPGWTGLTDRETGMDKELSEEELALIQRIERGLLPEEGYDPYEPTVEWFSSKLEVMPLSSAPDPKRRFVRSKHELARVQKIVRAIREGRITLKKPTKEEKKSAMYDIWADETPRPDHIMHAPAPKMLPPGHAESYNPPAEYLPTDAEREHYESLSAEDRRDEGKEFLPKKFGALRLVPGYENFVEERFERCLDLYLAPRVRRNKLNIDPESLIPKLPSPQDLRPFPTRTSTLYLGHKGRVRTVSCSPCGLWLATGGDDGTARVWEVLTGREVWRFQASKDEAVNVVEWSPNREFAHLAVAAGEEVYMCVPPVYFSREVERRSREAATAGFALPPKDSVKEKPATWAKPHGAAQENAGVVVSISVKKTVKQVSWHRRGDYFSTTSSEAANSAVLIHQLSTHSSQSPFKRSKGLVQKVEFHPIKPMLFVATQKYVRLYNLQRQELVKTLQTGVRWISSLDVHPGGENVIVGSYDRRLQWFDLELSSKPYKSLKYHAKAVRSVRYHRSLPLFASASDDGTIQVFHGKVYNDLENALIVPLKVLRGHEVRESLGVLGVVWHTRQPWLFSAGADGVVRMWTE
ncbi:Ribosome bioproteinsis protein erb1 [Saitoella coloradoensis]